MYSLILNVKMTIIIMSFDLKHNVCLWDSPPVLPSAVSVQSRQLLRLCGSSICVLGGVVASDSVFSSLTSCFWCFLLVLAVLFIPLCGWSVLLLALLCLGLLLVLMLVGRFKCGWLQCFVQCCVDAQRWQRSFSAWDDTDDVYEIVLLISCVERLLVWCCCCWCKGWCRLFFWLNIVSACISDSLLSVGGTHLWVSSIRVLS